MRELRELLGDYEVTFEPVMTPPGLKWAPYVTLAVAPYRVTRLARCRVDGLHEALHRTASRDVQPEGGSAAVLGLDDSGAGVIELSTHRPRRLRNRLRNTAAAH